MKSMSSVALLIVGIVSDKTAIFHMECVSNLVDAGDEGGGGGGGGKMVVVARTMTTTTAAFLYLDLIACKNTPALNFTTLNDFHSMNVLICFLPLVLVSYIPQFSFHIFLSLRCHAAKYERIMYFFIFLCS